MKKFSTTTRREFLKTSAMFAASISISGVVSCDDSSGNEPDPEPDLCETTTDILGPYYKAGAPSRENIIPVGNETDPLLIAGQVFSDCDTLIDNATVEIWNADENGDYDTSLDYKFRGKFLTGTDGAYKFKTILPGRYLNGSTFRPSHIHFRVTAEGYQDLVSQVYFKEDPFIDSDPWASAPKAKGRILAITQDSLGVDVVNFDIYLEKLV